MSEGLPRLLDLLAMVNVSGTFFTTGEMARRFPAIVQRLVKEGHELGCHGDQHLDFTTLTREQTCGELRDSLHTLRQFAPVVSFRAPYLRFPAEYLPLLVEHGLHIDSSIARYKFGRDHRSDVSVPGLIRVPASLTSSVLRLPSLMRNVWLSSMRPPVVIFVHPWEAVDFRSSALRLDCRFHTGDVALRRWRDVLLRMHQRGARFRRLNQIAVDPETAQAGADSAQSSNAPL